METSVRTVAVAVEIQTGNTRIEFRLVQCPEKASLVEESLGAKRCEKFTVV
jgi:hypothetical protein